MGGANMLILCALMIQFSADAKHEGKHHGKHHNGHSHSSADVKHNGKHHDGHSKTKESQKVSRQVSSKAQTKQMTAAQTKQMTAALKPKLAENLAAALKGENLVPHLKHRQTPPPTTEDEYKEQLTELAGDNILKYDTSTTLNGHRDDSAGLFGRWLWYHYIMFAGVVAAVGYKYDLGKYMMDMRHVMIPGYGKVNADQWLKGATKAESDDLFLAGLSSYGGATMQPSWDPMKPKAKNTARSEVISGPLGPLAPAPVYGPLGGCKGSMENRFGPVSTPMASMMTNPLDDDAGL